MEFASADPSVVKSIRQRYLLNEWLFVPAAPADTPSADEIVELD
jgi:hypothetical protein